jgi:hypothetical protein
MEKYERFLNNYYNMKSKITLKDYLNCLLNLDCVDVLSIDAETKEEYFGTFGKYSIETLSKDYLKLKVVKINNNKITIYKEK